MNKIIFLLNLLLTFSALAGGDLVNNGGGIAERNVLFAYSNLEFSLKLCLESPTCRLSLEEDKLLRSIRDHLSEERQNKGQIIFISENKHPGTFIIDGEMKAAVTGGKIGSPIFVNTDLLYSKKSDHQVEVLSVHDAIAMLVHELGHHHGNASHTELDLLGLKVSQYLNKSTYQTPLLPGGGPLTALFMNGIAGQSFPEVLLISDDQTFNLSESFKEQIACNVLALPIAIGNWFPPIGVSFKRPKALLVHNVYWEDIPKKVKGTFKIKGNITSYCENQKNEIKVNRNHKFEITFSLNRILGQNNELSGIAKWNIDQDSIKIRQVKDPWLRLLSLGF